jgi:hypothetical protein
LSDEDISGKFIELAVPVIGEAQAKPLLARLWRVEQAPTIDW